LVAEILKIYYKQNFSALVLGNTESVLFPQQLYVFVAAQLISCIIYDIFSNISATKII